MGYKKRKFIVACVILSLLQNPLNVKAETTAVELYNFFDMPYNLVYPEDTLDTINSYIYAQKFDRMYHYVVTSQYDESILINRIESAKARLEQVTADLKHGYSLPKNEIYSLESEYSQLTSYIKDEEKKFETVPVTYTIPTRENTPTYIEYVDACNNKAAVEAYADIGTVAFPMEAPVASSWLIEDSDSTSVSFKVANGTSVYSMWNGTVLAVVEDRIVISCNNEILIGYANMKDISVEEGDTVYQGQPIGKANSQLKLKLSLNNTFVDISKLFIKE